MDLATQSFVESVRLDPETETVLRSLKEMYPNRHCQVAVKANVVLWDTSPAITANPSIEITLYDDGIWVFEGSTFDACLEQVRQHKARMTHDV